MLFENKKYDDFFKITEIIENNKYKTIYFIFNDEIYSCDLHGELTESELETYDLDKKIVVKKAVQKFPEIFL